MDQVTGPIKVADLEDFRRMMSFNDCTLSGPGKVEGEKIRKLIKEHSAKGFALESIRAPDSQNGWQNGVVRYYDGRQIANNDGDFSMLFIKDARDTRNVTIVEDTEFDQHSLTASVTDKCYERLSVMSEQLQPKKFIEMMQKLEAPDRDMILLKGGKMTSPAGSSTRLIFTTRPSQEYEDQTSISFSKDF